MKGLMFILTLNLLGLDSQARYANEGDGSGNVKLEVDFLAQQLARTKNSCTADFYYVFSGAIANTIGKLQIRPNKAETIYDVLIRNGLYDNQNKTEEVLSQSGQTLELSSGLSQKVANESEPCVRTSGTAVMISDILHKRLSPVFRQPVPTSSNGHRLHGVDALDEGR